jgi:hypothetical protein
MGLGIVRADRIRESYNNYDSETLENGHWNAASFTCVCSRH